MGGRGAVRHRAQCRQQQPNGHAVDDIVLESILIYTLRGAFTKLMFCCLDDDDLFKSPFCSCFLLLEEKDNLHKEEVLLDRGECFLVPRIWIYVWF